MKRIKVISAAAILLAVITGLTGIGPAGVRGETGTWQGGMYYFDGYGGVEYYKPEGYYINLYGDDGELTGTVYHSGGNRQLMYYVTEHATGEIRYVYCLASGLNFSGFTVFSTDPDSQDGFMSYYNVLPAEARRGIALASLLGYSDRTMSPLDPGPVQGTNGGDFWVATQCIIWEYQQGIRTDPLTRSDCGPVEADTYFNMLRGRPAEKCYDYLLREIAAHDAVPGFASRDSAGWEAATLELHEVFGAEDVYESEPVKITGAQGDAPEISDENGEPIPYLTLERSAAGDGYYTLRSTRAIETPLKVRVRKNCGTEEGSALFFTAGKEDQTMLSCTGTLPDPFCAYFGVVTGARPSGGFPVKVKKQADIGTVAGLPFLVMWPLAGDHGETLGATVGYTDGNGELEITVPEGGNGGGIDLRDPYIIFAELCDGTYSCSIGSLQNAAGRTTVYVYEDNSTEAGWGYAATRSEAQSAGNGKVYEAYKISLDQSSEESGVSIGVKNTRTRGSVRIIKTSDTGEVSGFSIRLTGADPSTEGIVYSFVTGSNGIAEWFGVPTGTYLAEEILPEDSVWEKQEPRLVTVVSGVFTVIEFHNVRSSAGMIIEKTSEDDCFDGITFTVADQELGYSRVFTPEDGEIVTENGQKLLRIRVSGLMPGTYTVTEEVPLRYAAQEPVTVTVTTGNTVTLRLNNSLQRCRLSITKQIRADEFVPAHGDAVFIFTVSGTTYSGEERTFCRAVSFTAADLEAAEQGGDGRTELLEKTLEFEDLPAGEYTVGELSAVRYRFGSATAIGGTVTEETARFVLRRGNDSGEVTFFNLVVNQRGTSHTALCVNEFNFG